VDVAVVVTVSLQTLLGLADDPAQLAGYGAITATLARDLASNATWRCAVTDGIHGPVLGLGHTAYTPAYTPTRRLAELVRVIRPRCAFPGCRARADRCDLDHRLAWPGGSTCDCNLQPLCRRHHRLKTTGLITARGEPGGRALLWTTRAGLTYRTPEPSPLPGPALGVIPAPPPPTAEPPPPF
jgi:hypothetical protein